MSVGVCDEACRFNGLHRVREKTFYHIVPVKGAPLQIVGTIHIHFEALDAKDFDTPKFKLISRT